MKYWVFDLDGTLVDSFSHYFAIVEDLLNEKLTQSEKKRLVGMHSEQFFMEKLGPEKLKEAAIIVHERGMKDTAEIQAFSQVYLIFSALAKKNLSIAVLTNRDKASTELILEKTNLRPFIAHVVSGDCVQQRKPHPEGLLKIQKIFNCQKDEMVMVGDHDFDIEAGQQAGVYSVRVSWHNHWQEEPCQRANKQFFSDVEFKKWLSEIGIHEENQ